MDIIVTLKINDDHGRLTDRQGGIFFTDYDCDLDEFVNENRDEITQFLLDRCRYEYTSSEDEADDDSEGEEDTAENLQRYYYRLRFLRLSDELEPAEELTPDDKADEVNERIFAGNLGEII